MWRLLICGGAVFLLGQTYQLPLHPFVKGYYCKLSLHLLSTLVKSTYMLTIISCNIIKVVIKNFWKEMKILNSKEDGIRSSQCKEGRCMERGEGDKKHAPINIWIRSSRFGERHIVYLLPCIKLEALHVACNLSLMLKINVYFEELDHLNLHLVQYGNRYCSLVPKCLFGFRLLNKPSWVAMCTIHFLKHFLFFKLWRSVFFSSLTHFEQFQQHGCVL